MLKVTNLNQYFFGLILPLLLIVLILMADVIEGPKTAFVGVLACVPPLAASFGSVRMVILVSIAAFLGGFSIGYFASDGNVAAQETRLMIIAIVSLISIYLTRLRIQSQTRLTQMASELAVASALNQESLRDFLTGKLNRNGIVTKLNEFDYDTKSVVIIDLDDFKSINDHHGHRIGDEFLKAVSMRIASELKSDDIFGRWGGDEFVAVLPNDEAQTCEIFERVLDRASHVPFKIADLTIPIRFSVGVAQWNPNATFDSVLHNADRCLYLAKNHGGGSVKRLSDPIAN